MPLLEVPSGVLADRWSRNRIMVLACVALLVSSTIGGSATPSRTYVVAAVALGGYYVYHGYQREPGPNGTRARMSCLPPTG